MLMGLGAAGWRDCCVPVDFIRTSLKNANEDN